MKILVTGASGFIGRALCEHMVGLGLDVIAAVRQQSAVPGERILHADDAVAWQQALRGCQSVVHLAGRAHVMRECAADPLQAFRDANLGPTLALARQASQAGVRRFVFVSSVKVNGENTSPGACFTAEDSPEPSDPYAISKWEAEQGLRQVARDTGIEWVIVRPPLVYGAGVKGNFAQLVRLACKGLPLPFGAVRNQRSLIGIDNFVRFLTLCAQADASPRAAGQVFLVADGPAISTPQLMYKIAHAHHKKLRLVPVPPSWLKLVASSVGQGQAIDRLLGSLVVDDQTSKLLGWQAPFTMDEQLQRMARAASA